VTTTTFRSACSSASRSAPGDTSGQTCLVDGHDLVRERALYYGPEVKLNEGLTDLELTGVAVVCEAGQVFVPPITCSRVTLTKREDRSRWQLRDAVGTRVERAATSWSGRRYDLRSLLTVHNPPDFEAEEMIARQAEQYYRANPWDAPPPGAIGDSTQGGKVLKVS
jgi:hypothetical protein